MTIDITDKEIALAKRIATNTANTLGIEADDIEGTLLLWLVENYKYVTEYRDRDDGQYLLKASLKRAAHQAAAKEIKETEATADHEWYTIEQLKRTLPYMWEHIPESIQYTTHIGYDPDLIEHITIMLTEITTAYEQLTEDERHVLAWKYHDDRTHQEIARLLGTTEEAARKKTARAITKLHRLLGGNKIYGHTTRRQYGHGPDA